MFNPSDRGKPGVGPALDTGKIFATTTKRNPGRSAGKGPALETGSDMKVATNDEGTGNLAAMPLGPHRFVLLPPVVDPSGSAQNSETGSHVTAGEAPGEQNS